MSRTPSPTQQQAQQQQQQEQPRQSRNPFLNPSPPTRRPSESSPTSSEMPRIEITATNATKKGNDPPPAYSENPTSESGPTLPPSPAYQPRDSSPAPSNMSGISISTPEDPYAFLSSFDTVFVIDDSGSMAGRSWREVHAALNAITPICVAHDKDGIDVHFLNHRSSAPAEPRAGKAQGGYSNITDEAAVNRIFSTVRPSGMTPTGTRLQHILKAYLNRYKQGIDASGDSDDSGVKPINIIVVTDGAASDDPESVLVNAARKLDAWDAPPHQVGVQFFQVGNEPGAREALSALDDDLTANGGGVRDMVDTVTFTRTADGSVPVLSADGILKTVLGAVVKRLDRTRLSADRRSARSGLLRP